MFNFLKLFKNLLFLNIVVAEGPGTDYPEDYPEENNLLDNPKQLLKIQGDKEYSKTGQGDPDYNTIAWGFANYSEGRNILIGDRNYLIATEDIKSDKNIILGDDNTFNNIENTLMLGRENTYCEGYSNIFISNNKVHSFSSLLVYNNNIDSVSNSILFNNSDSSNFYQCLAFGNNNLKSSAYFSMLFGNYVIESTLNSSIVFRSTKGYYNASIGFYNNNVNSNQSITLFSGNSEVNQSFLIGTDNNFSTNAYDLNISHTLAINFNTNTKVSIQSSYINNFINENNNEIINSVIQSGLNYNINSEVFISNSFIQTNYNLENSVSINNSYLKILSNDVIKIDHKINNSFIHGENIFVNEDIENSFAIGKELQIKNQSLIFGYKNENKENTIVEIANDGNVFEINKDTGAAICPKLEITDIQDPKTLVTKEYIDSKSFNNSSYNIYKTPLINTDEKGNIFNIDINTYQNYSTFYIEINSETNYNEISIEIDTNPNYKVLVLKFIDKEKAKDFIQNYKNYLRFYSKLIVINNYDFYLEKTLNDYLNYIDTISDFENVTIKFSLQRDVLFTGAESLNSAVYIGLLWIGAGLDQIVAE